MFDKEEELEKVKSSSRGGETEEDMEMIMRKPKQVGVSEVWLAGG